MDLKKLDKVNIHFIIGPGRSGTTLLALILNQHKECISTPELKHFLYFYEKYHSIQKVTPELLNDLKDYFDVVGVTKKNVLFNIEDNFFLRGLTVGQEINYARLTKLIYLGFFKTIKNIDEVTCIIDKNPFYTFHADKILNVFPDAKFITLIRDYRAFVLSNRQSQKPFIMVKSTSYYAYAWNYHADRLIEIKNKHPEKLLVVNYEKMVADKETEVAKLFKHVGLSYTPDVFDFHKNLMAKVSEMNLSGKTYDRAIKKISDLSRPINASRVNSWKENLSTFQKKNIEFISGSRGKFFGYETEQDSTIFEKLIFMIIGIPGYIRVALFYMLNSVKIHHYLNEVRKAKFEKKYQ